MNIRGACGAVVIGALGAIAAVPANPSLAQSDHHPGVSTPASPAARVTPFKHRHWRHLGGRHPHYGSRAPRHAPAPR